MHKIAEAVEKCHLGHSKILCLCLRKFFAVHPERLMNSFADQLVEYQPKGMGYKIIGFIFDVDTYNLSVNFRVFCRISVSKLITSAIAMFLDEVVEELTGGVKKVHNYMAHKHVIRHNQGINQIEWHVVWNLIKKREEDEETKRNRR